MEKTPLAGLWQYAEELAALLYPNTCTGCQQPLLRQEKLLCTGCLVTLPATDYHLHAENDLARRFWGRVPLVYALAFLHYSKKGKVQRMIHALKYRGNQEIGVLLGELYGQLLLPHFCGTFDAIVPVPLHISRQMQRGYNQSEAIAKGLSNTLGAPLDTQALRRQLQTATQTKKVRYARWENVSEVFVLHRQESVAQKRILLVDDVVTTGATIEACAQILLKGGASSVSLCAMASAV